MGTRIVLPYGANDDFIKKIIPEEISFDSLDFPSLDDFALNPECLSKFETPIYNLIFQQYWEYYNWYNASEPTRQFLAPIVHTYVEKTPVLCFPKFLPLVAEEQVYEYNEIESLIAAGITMGKINLDINQCLEFYRNIPAVCNYLNIDEADIIYNPSNIGYHPTLGLRIIDYGFPNI